MGTGESTRVQQQAAVARLLQEIEGALLDRLDRDMHFEAADFYSTKATPPPVLPAGRGLCRIVMADFSARTPVERRSRRKTAAVGRPGGVAKIVVDAAGYRRDVVRQLEGVIAVDAGRFVSLHGPLATRPEQRRNGLEEGMLYQLSSGLNLREPVPRLL